MILRPPVRQTPVKKLKPNRYLKIASAKNPDTDFIELNDFNGFLCTSFQTVGISRKLEYLAIKNRQFAVDNKTNFKKYSLSIEILTKYSEYEAKHRELITFLDRNKKDGLRLYYRPYNGMDLRYCLCDIESSNRPEKMQPVTLTLSQGSLWLGEEKKEDTTQTQPLGNFFAFTEDVSIEPYPVPYYGAKFLFVNTVNDYCISLYHNSEAKATITNNGYNDIPLKIRINGYCVNPIISLFKKGESKPIRETQIFATIAANYYLEINANILECGVWLVNNDTKEKVSYIDTVGSESSPYFYIENGEYYITVKDDANNSFVTNIFYQEEYSE